MRFLPIIILIIGCSSPKSPVIEWGSYRAENIDDNWTIQERGLSYPGNSLYIEELLEDFENSKKIKIGKIDDDLLIYYGFNTHRIGNYLIGNKLPGELGRYLYRIDSKTLYRAIGNLSEYDLFRNLKDLNISHKMNIGEILFITINDSMVFENDAEIFFNNILRSDILDLVPDTGSRVLNAEIKYSNGRVLNLEIKKGEQGYYINLGSPYSYLISLEDFTIISSF